MHNKSLQSALGAAVLWTFRHGHISIIIMKSRTGTRASTSTTTTIVTASLPWPRNLIAVHGGSERASAFTVAMLWSTDTVIML